MAGLTSLLSSSLKNKLNERNTSVLLFKTGPDGTIDPDSGFRFQYFPETLSDTKAINYSPREVLGGNLPIYQWINGGERLISFTAMFTSDLEPGKGSTESTDQVGHLNDLDSKGLSRRNVDIKGAIAYLRSCMMPTYYPDKVQAPPVLLLKIFGSGIGLGSGFAPDADPQQDSILCQMSQCDVEYRQFFSKSGLPRIASVSLTFQQVGQYGGNVSYPGNVPTEGVLAEFTDRYLLKPTGD